jgi:EAL domain-containing protein (putative c-di-GMP-specific phosphodiesterase class I)
MDTGDGEEFKLAPAIRRAMAANEFSIHYQPQINTTYGSVTSAEALLRWEHPEYGQVSPFKFVPVAEESGLIVELGNWVLLETCRQLQMFREQGLDLPRVAINVSPQQLSQDFPGQVHDALRQFGLEGSSLELGLSEDMLARDDGRALYILMELKAMGIHLSLENFGTTPSSFVYISRYPLDDIKIDRSFVAECDQREEAHKLVDAVIAMASSLGLVAVAEGVETEGEYRYLVKRGVRVMRGYLFSRPIPADELREQVGAPWHFMKRIQNIEEPGR